jgi:hypothetical protein
MHPPPFGRARAVGLDSANGYPEENEEVIADSR